MVWVGILIECVRWTSFENLRAERERTTVHSFEPFLWSEWFTCVFVHFFFSFCIHLGCLQEIDAGRK